MEAPHLLWQNLFHQNTFLSEHLQNMFQHGSWRLAVQGQQGPLPSEDSWCSHQCCRSPIIQIRRNRYQVWAKLCLYGDCNHLWGALSVESAAICLQVSPTVSICTLTQASQHGHRASCCASQLGRIEPRIWPFWYSKFCAELWAHTGILSFN